MTEGNDLSKKNTRGKLRLVVDNEPHQESAYKMAARATAATKLADWLESEHLRTEGRARRDPVNVENCPADDVVVLAIEMLFGRGYTANYTLNSRGAERRGTVWVARRSNFLK